MLNAFRALSWQYRVVALALLVLLALAWSSARWLIEQERDARLAEGAEQARRLAVFFERQTRGIFRYGDSYLKMVRREYVRTRDLDAVRDLMAAVPLDKGLVSHITIIDEAGTPILVSGFEIKPGTTAKDRAYFKHHQQGSADELFVSLPHRGRNSGKLIMRLVRRYESEQGGFGGVMFAALDAESITGFFGAMNLGPNSSATLVGLDKRIRARSSYGRLGPGQDISGSRIWRELEASPVGLYRQTSVVDGITRHYAYRRLAEFPLIVAIGVSTEDIARDLASFQTSAYGLALSASLVMLTLVLLLYREVSAGERLRASESHVRTVVETVRDGILTFDASGRIESANAGAARMFGRPPDELAGLEIRSLYAEPADAPGGADGALLAEGYRRVEARRADGTPFPAEVAVGEIRRDGARIFVSTVRDITERVEAAQTIQSMNDELEQRVRERTAELETVQEELLRKERLAVLGQLTGSVAHELRNPLGTISTSTAVLERRLPAGDEMLQGTMQRIRRSVERCNVIITELLDFARVRGIEPRPAPLDRWLGEVLDEISLPGNVALRRAHGASGVVVDFDHDRVRRAVFNLIENAVHALGDAGGEVRVSTRAAAGRVEIEVADDGPGIPEDLLGKSLEPLFSTKSFGVGLGLPIVSRIMEEHRGGLEISSRVGEGTRALLWLPREAAGAPAPLAASGSGA